MILLKTPTHNGPSHRKLMFILCVLMGLSGCTSAQRDEAVHRKHVTAGATVVGATAGALISDNNRVGGAILGGILGNIAGSAVSDAYVRNKDDEERQRLREREARLRRSKYQDESEDPR